jgi:hypothetical protein
MALELDVDDRPDDRDDLTGVLGLFHKICQSIRTIPA